MKKLKFEDLILFENDDFIVINKPPFFATLDERFQSDTVKSLAIAYNPEARVVHRLDKDTSGSLLLAKSDESYRHASIQFEKRRITKKYHAVVHGKHNFQDLYIDLPLNATNKGKAFVDYETGKPSLTIAHFKKVYRNHSLIECWPITGRMHQIRLHLAHQGASLVNDMLYGGQPVYLSSLKPKFKLGKEKEERPIIQRFALHAKSISFYDMDENKIDVDAPYPKDFAVLMKQLEKFS